MGTTSKIEWTDRTWNPVVGCSYVSPGCDGCYAARDAAGRLKTNPTYAGLAHHDGTHPLPRFTGEVRLLPDRLDQPLHWRAPHRVFVNSMSDLFHPEIPLDFLARIWRTIERSPRHTFQILTKRPERIARTLGPEGLGVYAVEGPVPCPQPNVWLGTSVETQRYADLRIPKLLAAPAAVRFLSVEPLLGPVDLTRWLHGGFGRSGPWDEIGWVIVGGESGPGARPMHPEWARSLREQCVAAGVPFLFKQRGEWSWTESDRPWSDPRFNHAVALDGSWRPWLGVKPHGDEVAIARLGKKAAGRLLDGRTWDEYPA